MSPAEDAPDRAKTDQGEGVELGDLAGFEPLMGLLHAAFADPESEAPGSAAWTGSVAGLSTAWPELDTDGSSEERTFPVGRELCPGEALGRFRIEAEIGRGGFGVVHRAVDARLGRTVALKVPRPDKAASVSRLRRFAFEARLVAGLDHDAIVKVHEAGVIADVFYIASEFQHGRPLNEWLADHPDGLAPRRAAALAARLADGVAHAHARGVLQRDLKPANVLMVIDPDHRGPVDVEKPRITDFGLGSRTETAGRKADGRPRGTAPYAAPEQLGLGDSVVDVRADVYALGAILYELLTGRPIFDCASLGELVPRLRRGERPAPPSRLRPGLPADLEAVCLKCLALDPAARYAIAADLADDLNRYLGHFPVACRTPSLLQRARLWARRSPWRAAAAATLIIATAAGAAGLTRYVATLQDRAEVDRQANVILARKTREAEHAAAEAKAEKQKTERALGQLTIAKAEAEQAGALARAQADRNRRHLHAAHLRQAAELIGRGDDQRAQNLLDNEGPEPGGYDPRGFAWRHLRARARRDFRVLRGHDHEIGPIVLSPDGRTLATGDARSWGGQIRLWDADDARAERPRMVIEGHKGPVRSLAFSPDGRRLASIASRTKEPGSELIVWDFTNGQRLATIPLPKYSAVRPAFLAGTSQIGLYACKGKDAEEAADFLVYDLAGTPPSLTPRHLWENLHFETKATPDGRILGDFGGTTFGLFDPAADRFVWTRERPEYETWLAAVSGDGKTIATAVRRSRHVLFRDIETGDEVGRLEVEGQIAGLALGPLGRRVAILTQRRGAPGALVLPRHGFWSVQTPKQEGLAEVVVIDRAGGPAFTKLLDHGDVPYWPAAVSFSSDENRLATMFLDAAGALMDPTAWDLVSGTRMKAFRVLPRHSAWPTFSLDGGVLFFIDDDKILRWDLEPPSIEPETRLAGHLDEAWAVAFSPDGKILATGGDDTVEPQTIKLWDVATGRLIRGWKGHDAMVTRVAFSPDGALLASSSLGEGGVVRLWNVGTGDLVKTLDGPEVGVRALAFDPNGSRLYAGANDKRLWAWSAPNFNDPSGYDGHNDKLRDIAFVRNPDPKRWSHGGVIATAANDGARMISPASFAPFRGARTTAPFTSVAIAPDGESFVAADELGEIWSWGTLEGEKRARIRTPDGELRALAYSPDGRAIAAAGKGGVVRLWDPATGEELLTLPTRASQVNGLTFAPDGTILAAVGHDGAVTLWRAPDRETLSGSRPPRRWPGRPTGSGSSRPCTRPPARPPCLPRRWSRASP